MFRIVLRVLVVVLLAAGTAGLAAAEKPAVFASEGAAIRGYDPVAYFTAGKPVKGSPQFTLQWNGATWHFASAANRDAFRAEPAKYAPQYGGYCAYGAAQGYAVQTDPAAWRIVDGKLYLNYNAAVQSRWVQDIPGYIKAADKNWPHVLNK
jgi:YHS domain-containing protein